MIAKGRYALQAALPVILTDLDNGLPELTRQMIHDLWLSIQQANEQILGYDRALKQLARADECETVTAHPGCGPTDSHWRGSECAGSAAVQEQSSVLCLAGTGATTIFDGWKDTSGANHEAG